MVSEMRGKPLSIHLQMRSFATDLLLPPETEVLCTREPEPLPDVPAAVREALSAPIGTVPLVDLCRAARAQRPSVAVVVSDNTRPVPYRGEGGILWPLVSFLLEAGFPPESITLVVATGTHRLLSDEEIWSLLDERVRLAGVRVHCHDAADPEKLTWAGQTSRGADVYVNRRYVEADLRILTGLVEPHLMAGVSGGRKSICPGLLNVQSVRDFHGPVTLAHEKATDLVLDGNPCHEVSLEIARMVPPDFILNVTMRQDGKVAGVFAGDMEKAHLAAVDHMTSFTRIPLKREYDVVVVHGGHVGINHYQAEKAAAVAAKAVRPGGYVVVVADTTDPDPVGTESYRRMLKFLSEVGPEGYLRAIQSEDWEFVHDQWGVQTWTKLFDKVPPENVFYFSPQTALEDYPILCCADPASLLAGAERCGPGELVAQFVVAAVARACWESEAATGRKAAVAYLAGGPHGIPEVSRTAGD
jgi:lactate racemase